MKTTEVAMVHTVGVDPEEVMVVKGQTQPEGPWCCCSLQK